MPNYPGATANLRGHQRRSGRAGLAFISGEMRGEVVGLEWGLEVEQTAVPIPGTYQDEIKPGAETRRGTFRYHDVDDKYRLIVWDFLEARRAGNRNGAFLPEMDIISKIDDIGAAGVSQWALLGCQFFSLDGGFGQDDDLLQRDIPFVYRREVPLDVFEYVGNGEVRRRRS